VKQQLSNLVMAFSGTAIGARIFSRTAHHVDRIVFRLSGKRTTLTGWLTGFPLLMLHITGRKSGKSHSIPLLGIPDPDVENAFLLVASNFGKQNYPGWYYNLKAAGAVSCTLNGRRRDFVAVEVEGDAYTALWDHIVAHNPGYASYRKAIDGKRHIPVFRITPEQAQQ